MKTKLGKITAAFLVLALFVLMALGSGSSDDAKKVGEVPSNGTSSSTQNKNPADTEKKEETTKPQQTEFHVGDVLEAEGLKIVYVASGEYRSDNQFLQPKDGNKCIYIELAAENVSQSDKSISSFSFKCYADGYDCESYYGGDDDLSASLSAGRSTSGKVYFEVPKTAEKIEIEYEYNLFSDKKATFLYEGEQDSGYVADTNVSASENAFKVGDVVEGNGMKISYLSCKVWKSDNMFITPKDGCEFVACEFEFENTSSSDKMVSSIEFECYADGKNCDRNIFNDSDIGSTTLSSGRKTKGSL